MMIEMKRLFTIITICFLGISSLTGQGVDCAGAVTDGSFAWIVPAKPDVTDSVTIFIDVSKDPTCSSLIGTEEPLYMWAWGPSEPVPGNGDWNASNEAMKFKHVDGSIYSMTVIPTEFYNVDAATLYDRGLCFLAKQKDGGSGGDCAQGGEEFKTNDAHVVVQLPEDAVRKVFSFPDIIELDTVYSRTDDLFTLYYDQTIEEKETMQNVDNIWIYFRVVGDNGTTYKYTSLSKIGDNPELQMTEYESGKYRLSMIPEEWLSDILPEGVQISRLRFQFITLPLCGSDCAVDGDYFFSFKCK